MSVQCAKTHSFYLIFIAKNPFRVIFAWRIAKTSFYECAIQMTFPTPVLLVSIG
ncbi:MAG: hypothetical protein NT027_20490 [Proteobacteria bacterium]|nr:hypothetical protein [Pseudomonadota bacterium]